MSFLSLSKHIAADPVSVGHTLEAAHPMAGVDLQSVCDQQHTIVICWPGNRAKQIKPSRNGAHASLGTCGSQ